MEALESVYIDEVAELIGDLEAALLTMEGDKDDASAIESIFRSMHTLKGSSSMFGFDQIGRLTHDLENVYDKIRDNQIKLSKGIYDITLQSVDHIRCLLKDPELSDPELKASHDSLLLAIGALNRSSQPEKEIIIQESVNESDIVTYQVIFKPEKDILKNGTNPLYIIEELCSLGNSLVLTHTQDVPNLNKFDPAVCYTRWEIYLATGSPIEEINDVFLFVEGMNIIEINELTKGDGLDHHEFHDTVNVHFGKNCISDPAELKAIFDIKPAKQEEKAKETKGKNSRILADNNISSIRVASDKLDHLMNLVSELVTTQARLNLYAENSNVSELNTITEDMDKLSRQLRDNTFSICLIPIQGIFMRFQRLIRDITIDLGKKVEFTTEGGDTELDKNIIEKIVDPVMHILRNSLDHGIEMPEERLKQGKAETGSIILKTYYSGSNVHIQIKDDGAGIDVNKIRQKAENMGVIEPSDKLSDQDILSLIFKSGLTTAEKITNVSGRGVGMDVVRQRIDEIRGEIEIQSEKGKGTTITIKLPLTLSILDGLMLKIADDHYVIPMENVQKIYAIKHEELKNEFQKTIILDDELYPYLNLKKEFEAKEIDVSNEQIVIINYENKQIGLVVDSVVGEYQAVLKPIGKLYKEQEYISGATIMGDGSVALVLDPFKIVKQFVK